MTNEYLVPVFRNRDYRTYGMHWNTLYGVGYLGAAHAAIGDRRTTVVDAGTYCCAQVIIRNGMVELMACCWANSFHALASVGRRSPRMRSTMMRKAAAISERAEMKVIGGIEPSPILVSG